MDTVAEAISDLTYAFDALTRYFRGLSEAGLSHEVVEAATGRTARDILAHLIGWEDYVLDALPAMLTSIDIDLPPVDAEARDRQATDNRRGRPSTALLEEFEAKHRQILRLLQQASPQDLTVRRTRRGQIFTIKSYIVDILKEHLLEHSEQLKLWQANRKGRNLS